MAVNFPNLKKETDVQVQDAQRVQKRMKKRTVFKNHGTITKCSKCIIGTSDKEE